MCGGLGMVLGHARILCGLLEPFSQRHMGLEHAFLQIRALSSQL